MILLIISKFLHAVDEQEVDACPNDVVFDINNDNVFVAECTGSDFWLHLNSIDIFISLVQLSISVPMNGDGSVSGNSIFLTMFWRISSSKCSFIESAALARILTVFIAASNFLFIGIGSSIFVE